MKSSSLFPFSSLLFFGLIGLLVFSACDTKTQQVRTEDPKPNRPLQKGPSIDPSQFDLSYFHLDVGDIIYIKVHDENIEGTFQVYPDCTIQIPLLESVRICGKTPGRIRREIADGLYKDFLKRRPAVVVKVTEFNSKKIFVFGEVSKPGRFDYTPGLTLIQVIAMAGGFGRRAARNDTRLFRTLEGGMRKVYRIPLGALDRRRFLNRYLRPGDMIYVPESWF
ncbi:MAG: polysaccharide biosynthesis/export family protein [Myxococcales bacterium]|nr:polysaccharide biosynthesis/export family protein [Myxococcales bacterium]